jgi:hypothetical protein
LFQSAQIQNSFRFVSFRFVLFCFLFLRLNSCHLLNFVDIWTNSSFHFVPIIHF